jgi:DNA polymerase-3 subunit epsilon
MDERWKGYPEFHPARLPPFVALDFETANRTPTSACALGLVRVERNLVTARHYYLMRPARGSWIFSDLHGISYDDVRDQPTFGDLWPGIAPILTECAFVVAHNASFDARVLRACCRDARLRTPRLSYVCSLAIAQNVLSIHPGSLSNVCHQLRIELNHHHALSDAEAAARIVLVAESRGWRWYR